MMKENGIKMINEKDTSKEKTFDENNKHAVINCIDNAGYIMLKIGIQKSDNIKADVEKAISELEEVVDIDKSGFATKTIRMLQIFLVDCASKALDIREEIDKLLYDLNGAYGDLNGVWGKTDEKY